MKLISATESSRRAAPVPQSVYHPDLPKGRFLHLITHSDRGFGINQLMRFEVVYNIRKYPNLIQKSWLAIKTY